MSIQRLLSLILFPSFARAAIEPVSPGPGDVFRSGSPCPISWNTDRSGPTQSWKNATIYLMSGSNGNMSMVTTVVEHLDETNMTSYNWLCPDVAPNAAIYFYQFSNNGVPTGSTWTSRFTIASYSGNTTLPENSKQPDRAPIPWGVGHLVTPKSTNPSSPNVSPRSRSLPIPPCETLKHHQCMTSPEDASFSHTKSPANPPLRQRIVLRPTVTDQVKPMRERRPSSRGSRGGPDLSVHILCALATLWLMVL
ncbi:uncharacterized protein HD556DRAFT_1224656 [Suillus plorans]|uniref:Yeast cell wall synthesis Kre9/Knh1-like N-terminal domain-containing protein n=1 Tax=Suillus plorans TaxID=116603 RepID=A0A9P7DYX0_9AGAM|nr:uncharacterized protein HD556DRAFT_1224656 [Suillus plorans]KAG1806754.1 hypothetical protein HD556DRAFT_1224656 [Suillus plorans]